MEELTPGDLAAMLQSGQIRYDQLYNLDLEHSQYKAIKHYTQHEYDNVDVEQKMNILLFDIEVYTNHTAEFLPDNAKQPISAITVYSTFEKIYHCFFLVLPVVNSKINQAMMPEFLPGVKKELFNKKYLLEGEDIRIYLFSDELNMMKECFNTIHYIDPVVITGFYADFFDLPYIYNRLVNLTGSESETNKIISKFGTVKHQKLDQGRKVVYHIPEYPLMDIRRLYMPRIDGGLTISSH